MTTLSRAIAAGVEGVRGLPRWLVLSLAGVGFVLLWGIPTLIIPLATDQILFSLGARTILDGGQLYQDYWEIKSPLIHLIYAIPFALAGEHVEGIRVLDMVSTVLAMGAIYLLSRRLFNERAAILAAAFYAFTYLTSAQMTGLANAESFMAAPLALAFFLYRPEDGRRGAWPGALAAGLLLGLAFALKTTALLFILGLPAAEVFLREAKSWTVRGALQRLTLAAAGFLFVQGVLAGYLAIGGALGAFVDIQRNYTAGYNGYRFAPEGSHVRFLVDATSNWIKGAAFILVPAAVALFFALYRPRHTAAIGFLALVVALGVLGVWWQGKMYPYHWVIMIPLLAPLAGYAVDQLLGTFSTLARPRVWMAQALLAGGLFVLATDLLEETYDNYRTLANFAGGSVSRREIEARFNPELVINHELVDYVRLNGDTDDTLFIWGFWPAVYFWAEQPLVTRFVDNHGLRATWSPDSWRQELLDDLEAAPPRFLAVARHDNQPWLVGTTETSDEHLRDSFPELRQFVEAQYVPVQDMGLFLLYERTSARTERPAQTAR